MVRKIALKLLKLTAFDLNIKHHITNFNFNLNSYSHKGYWFYGKKREKNTVKNFLDIIKPNDYVLEIGGHIGYFSTLYSKLVGKEGKVDVFEPSKKNLQYLKRNIKNLPENLLKNVTVVEKGAGDIDGTLEFFIDPITGQNNSFVRNFEGFFQNRKFSADEKAELISETVEVIRLDTYFKETTELPNFVKIDVEGFEWNVIDGFKETIKKSKPNIMIEIQADQERIINFFLDLNYKIFNDEMMMINTIEEYNKLKTPNIFFIFE